MRAVLAHQRTPAILSLGLSLAMGMVAAPAGAVEYVLGDADIIALDQPRITFGLTDESATPVTLIGPLSGAAALLDTGANGVLLGQLSYLADEDYGFVGIYNEQGVAGTSPLDVHDTHGLRITDSNGVQRLIGTDIRPFGDDSLSLGSYSGILGMPVMDGYAVEVDLRPMLLPALVDVVFHDSFGDAPFESAGRLDVALRIVPPVHTDTALPANLRPTFSGLPVVDRVDMQHTGGALSGGGTFATNDKAFLIDTGAQTTIISEQMARDMMIDFSQLTADGGDVEDYLEVGGIGGSVAMPLVTVDRFVLPTESGIELVWTNITLGVLDIDGAPFDAVLGMNLLTTGYIDALGGTGDPFFDKVVFDFTPTDDTATMRLDMYNPVPIPEPGSLAIAVVGCALLSLRRRRGA